MMLHLCSYTLFAGVKAPGILYTLKSGIQGGMHHHFHVIVDTCCLMPEIDRLMQSYSRRAAQHENNETIQLSNEARV